MSGTNDTRTRAIVDLGLTILTARQQARDIDELWDRLSRAYAVIRRETPFHELQREIEQLRAQLERQRTSA
jgi:hypothetical protein